MGVFIGQKHYFSRNMLTIRGCLIKKGEVALNMWKAKTDYVQKELYNSRILA